MKVIAVLIMIMCSIPCLAKGKRENPPAAPNTTATPATPTAPPAPEQERYYQADDQIAFYATEFIAGDPVLYNSMARYGCKFMAALGIAQTHAQKTLSARQINTLRSEAQSRGLVSSDMSTPDAAAVINMALSVLGSRLSATQVGRVPSLDRIVELFDSTIIYGETVNGNPHFCEGDNEGEIIYNPSPRSVYREIINYILIRISGYRLLDPLRSTTGG